MLLLLYHPEGYLSFVNNRCAKFRVSGLPIQVGFRPWALNMGH